MVPFDGRLREALAQPAMLQPPRLRYVGDVEQRQLEALEPAVVGGVLPDAQQQLLADRVQVGGVAGDLELAGHARGIGIGEVERVERVGLAEGDDVADVADEADRVDALAQAEAADHAALHEPAVAPGERRDPALRVGVEAGRGRDAQHVGVLGHRELVQQRAGNRTAARVAGPVRVGGVEAVDRGVGAEAPVLVPALRRDVERGVRGIDVVGAGEDRVRVDRGQAGGEVDGVDGQHAGAGEERRAPDGTAADRARRPRRSRPLVGERRSRQPAGRPPTQLPRSVGRPGLRRHDHPRGAAGQARVDDVAVDVLRAQHAHLGGIGHVDLGHARAARPAAEHERTAIEQQQRRVPAVLQLQHAEQPRRRRARADRVQRSVGEREDRPAVGLDDVRLVDAGLLDVGLRRVLRSALRRRGRALIRDHGDRHVVANRRARHVPGGVADQRRARS